MMFLKNRFGIKNWGLFISPITDTIVQYVCILDFIQSEKAIKTNQKCQWVDMEW